MLDEHIPGLVIFRTNGTDWMEKVSPDVQIITGDVTNVLNIANCRRVRMCYGAKLNLCEENTQGNELVVS